MNPDTALLIGFALCLIGFSALIRLYAMKPHKQLYVNRYGHLIELETEDNEIIKQTIITLQQITIIT